eukprot:CAMPEP_0172439900 /NCGR_PEP_ID=MMETSP1065-20121228/742_1 /TAXON_ID=265537 /ORGANISM="Amphiprora paludosa, Strain CCMP125" /LENGTH=30 /DNA_ID= /DNA_START= /DNA_END= /DNA_ORIENTATION=
MIHEELDISGLSRQGRVASSSKDEHPEQSI